MPKIVIKLPAQGIEADTKVEGTDAAEISVEPYFFNPDAAAPVAYLTVMGDDGKVLRKAALQLAGNNGAFKLLDVTSKVAPRFAKKKTPQPSPKVEGAKP